MAVAPHIWARNCSRAARHIRAKRLRSENSETQVRPDILKTATERSISVSSVSTSSGVK